MANKSGPNRKKIILNEYNNIITDDQDIICIHSSILAIKKNVFHFENDFSFTHVNQSDV